MSPVVPKCLALILCDSVNRPAGGGDPSVIRAFAVFGVASLPTKSPPFSVWIQLTDGNGPAKMRLFIEHIPPGRLEPDIVVPIEFTLNFENPNVVLEHDIVLDDGIYLGESGRYRLRLTADGTTILQRYFIVQFVP